MLLSLSSQGLINTAPLGMVRACVDGCWFLLGMSALKLVSDMFHATQELLMQSTKGTPILCVGSSHTAYQTGVWLLVGNHTAY